MLELTRRDEAQRNPGRLSSDLLCADFGNILADFINCGLQNLKTNFGRMLPGAKARTHLLKWMDIISEVS